MSLDHTPRKVNHLVSELSESAEHAAKSTQQAANAALENITGAMQDLGHQTKPMLTRATEQVSALAHQGLDSVHDTTHQWRMKATQAGDNTVNYIKHEPVKSMLIAAATGAALMALVSLMGRGHNHR